LKARELSQKLTLFFTPAAKKAAILHGQVSEHNDFVHAYW
jgi:hypothetical protein